MHRPAPEFPDLAYESTKVAANADTRRLALAERRLPRYTSYPTALSFTPVADDRAVRAWAGGVAASTVLSAYVHVPFCDRLCWYCGCHTTVVHQYDRVAAFHGRLLCEIDLWAEALPPHAGTAHLHFGGGSPNALAPADFLSLARRLRRVLDVRAEAEVAVELDPGNLTDAFLDAMAAAGVTRASLGVQTFDPQVQRRVNRVQPLEMVAQSVAGLRARGVTGINFDLMYGLPGQDCESVAASARAAADLSPDRVSVFGYAHVPWMKKHQVMIHEEELADVAGRWDQAEAADEVLTGAGYVRIGLDHYARPQDPLARAAVAGRLHRNFQGYTDDAASVLVPFGPSAIGRFAGGFVQNQTAMDTWSAAIAAGRLPIAKTLPLTPEDCLRAAVIERLMCDLTADVGEICAAGGFAIDALDGELHDAAKLSDDGLCRVDGRRVRIPETARRLMRLVAACFDADLPLTPARHARAV